MPIKNVYKGLGHAYNETGGIFGIIRSPSQAKINLSEEMITNGQVDGDSGSHNSGER